MPAPLKVALLGYGYAGRTFHAPLLAATRGLALVAIGTSDPAKVAADLPGIRTGPVAAVATDAAADIVVIATPNATHAELARAALLAGRHVVVDKPFTLTLAEARDLADLADRTGRLLSVFHNRRWDADFLTLRRLLADGTLGQPVLLESRFDRYRPDVRQRWREAAVPGAGLWYDLGPHLIDQVLQLFGPPQAVLADLARQRQGAKATDYCHVTLRYPGALRVILHASMLTAGETPRFALHGTRGSYTKHGLDPQEDALKRGELPGSPGWGHDPRNGTLTTWTADTPHTRPLPTEPGDYRTYYAGLRDAVLGQGLCPVPVAEAVAVMAVLEAALASAASGCERRLDNERA